jgi:hypothetical protein
LLQTFESPGVARGFLFCRHRREVLSVNTEGGGRASRFRRLTKTKATLDEAAKPTAEIRKKRGALTSRVLLRRSIGRVHHPANGQWRFGRLLCKGFGLRNKTPGSARLARPIKKSGRKHA